MGGVAEKKEMENKEKREEDAIQQKGVTSFEKQRHHNGRAQWHEARPSNKIKLTSI